jgi:hypothetical protein
MLPRAAAAKAGQKFRLFLNTRYPAKVNNHSSGTGRPTIPNTRSEKMAT